MEDFWLGGKSPLFIYNPMEACGEHAIETWMYLGWRIVGDEN